ncbi:folate-binding protein [Massilia sp. PAMC28688]|uniref:CAF17-like 4Fe-4S cluster assembly/insertion protein YgfZ n=1 Tax=Massilia sp. PAMC28688 TaxID=2861283 RepID=UPI001C6349ED|nr:folate-binding protein [Massilia sp. PAMC28688]QYF93135.1 folate-binding protein [Massilia sp. PAMC28688]
MTNWKEFLSSQAARHSATEPAHVLDFGRTLAPAELAEGFVAVIDDQGLIAVTGDDAASFLHSQLTNDVKQLGEQEARLAGYCTPKGRLQATFLMWNSAGTIYLQLPRAIQAPLQKRLSMFVMRAKAALSDATGNSATQVVLGFGGVRAAAVLEQQFGALPAAPFAKIDHASGTLIRLPDAFGAPRFQWITSEQAAMAAWPALSTALTPAGNDAWQLSSIHAGVPQVTLKTQEQFVPQMINFELLGGVNFKKGCYPGQEIVARSQYLGKLKRRTAIASIDAASAQAGDEVFDVSDPGQPCGMVVNAAPNGSGSGSDVLVEMKLAALDQGDIRLGSADGAPLRFQPMPYPLDALDL